MKNNLIQDVSNFIFIEDTPLPSDLIIAVGGSLPQIAEKAAQLYCDGYAPYVIAGGGFSVKLGRFKGVSDKKEIYSKEYRTEADFYADVLSRNGVPMSAILLEDKSGYTRQNAEFAKALTKEHGISVERLIIVCKAFHARRCQMFFQSVFRDSEVLIIPADIENSELGLTRDNWYKSEYGIKRVLGELSRCGEQITSDDINNYIAGGRV